MLFLAKGWDYVSELQTARVLTATVEQHWQGKIEEIGEISVPVPFWPSQIPHVLAQVQTRVSAVRGQWLNQLPKSLHGPQTYLQIMNEILFKS